MARPLKDTVQITFRIPKDWMRKADALAKRLSRPGLNALRTDAFRAALAEGFWLLEKREKRGEWLRRRTAPLRRTREEALDCRGVERSRCVGGDP
jgi:hypothetical protein